MAEHDIKEMDPELVWKLLEGHENLLMPEVEKEQAFFRHVTCPNCNSVQHEVLLDSKNPFTVGSPLPNKILKCLTCNTEFEPYTRFIRSVATPESTSEILHKE